MLTIEQIKARIKTLKLKKVKIFLIDHDQGSACEFLLIEKEGEKRHHIVNAFSVVQFCDSFASVDMIESVVSESEMYFRLHQNINHMKAKLK